MIYFELPFHTLMKTKRNQEKLVIAIQMNASVLKSRLIGKYVATLLSQMGHDRSDEIVDRAHTHSKNMRKCLVAARDDLHNVNPSIYRDAIKHTDNIKTPV